MPINTDVLATAVRLTAGGQDYLYPLVGPLHVAMITPFAGKIVVGDTTQSSQILLSEWVMNDWRGGGLVSDLDESSQADRFWNATLDTRFMRQLFLLPDQAQTAGVVTNVANGAGTRLVLQQYDANIYLATEDATNPVKRSTASLNSWTTVHTGGGKPYSACTLNTGAARWLVLGTDTGYTRYDGTTWTDVATSASIPRAELVCVYENTIW